MEELAKQNNLDSGEHNIYIEAKVYTARDGKYCKEVFCNVNIGGFLHIGSYAVKPTDNHPDRLDVFPPSYRIAQRNHSCIYKPYIEFPYTTDNRLCVAIRQACLSAYAAFENNGYKLPATGERMKVNLNNVLGSSTGYLTGRQNNNIYDEVAPLDISDDFDLDTLFPDTN